MNNFFKRLLSLIVKFLKSKKKKKQSDDIYPHF